MAERRALTARESEILDALCGGLTARQVGERLGISSRAVSNRRTLIYQKLGVGGLDEACLAVAAAVPGTLSETASAARESTAIDAPAERQLHVRIFPVHDVEFRTHVNSVVQGAARKLGPRELEDRLRNVFPSATVRVREQPGAQRGHDVWYVFRAAHVVDPREEPWWQRETDAWVLLDSDGVFMDISPAAEELLATTRDEALGRSLFEPGVPFTHEAEEDVRRLWATLRQRGHLHSSLRVPRRDGVIFDLDFYAEANVDGAGHHRAFLRALRPVPAPR
jgi:PAS domain S-box-containing protein